MYTGSQASFLKYGQSISTKAARLALEAAHRQFTTRSSAGNVSVLPFGTHIDGPLEPPYGHGLGMFQRSFVGRIILPPPPNVFDPDATGPPPPDYTDERYWVREVYLNDPTEFKTFDVGGRIGEVTYEVPKYTFGDPIGFDVIPDPPALVPEFPQRITVAHNLAELHIHTHALGVPYTDTEGVGRFVLCHVVAGWNGTQFTIFDAAVMAATEFVVVSAIVLEPVFALQVRPVTFRPQDNGAGTLAHVEYSGEPVIVWPWPNTPVSYYERYVWQGNLDLTTPILRAQQIGGQWHVEQNLRHRLPPYPTSQRFSDCTPPEFTLPDNSVGACCKAQGACEMLSAAECQQAGGIYMGPNTTCNVVDCCTLPEIDCDDVGPPGP